MQKLPENFTLFANFNGQSASKNLDSSEQFILGGPNRVRAYSGLEGMGDSGWVTNLEVRYDFSFGSDFGQWQWVGFYDAGHIKLHDDPKSIPIATLTGQNSYALSGWGMGLNLSKTDSYLVRLSWAEAIGDNPGRTASGLDANDRSCLWLQATLWF
ncbi:MAG: BamA/TamA family outer membrane protein [Magnetococcales bacterium]|nr:BamA/TamA family outer membrane protein [Magnetococcales bacterium]